MDFPKKQAQRLMPLYLLEYSEKLFTNHPDPSAPWGGGGGSDYTAGDGININDNVISVDNTIAKKDDIPTNYVTLDTEQTITRPKRITSRFYVGNPTGNEIFIDGNYGKGQLIDMYNDELGSAFCMMIDNNYIQGNIGAYFTYEDDKGLREYRLPYQDREGLTTCTLATNLDLPTKTSELTNDSGFITGVTWNDVTEKPTFATVATSGSYNDLTDKPTIPTVNNPTITFTQGGTTKGTITLNQSGDQTIEFDASASLPDSPFLKVDDPQDQMFFSLDGSDYSWSKYVDLSASPNKMFYVNLSALNPNYGTGLSATYNPQTCALDISIDENVIPNIEPNVPLSPVQTLSTLQVNGIVYGIPESKTYISGTGIDITNDTISVNDTVALKSEVPSTATSTSTSTVTPSTIELVFTYEDNTTQTITLMTGATVSTSTTTTLS